MHCLYVTFLVPGIQHRQENIFFVSYLDNSDNLNRVHCLYLLFVYMYIVCFSYVFLFRGPHGRMVFMPNVSSS